GCVGMCVAQHGYRGTTNGKVGYLINGVEVLKVIGAPDAANNEGTGTSDRTWGTMMYSVGAGLSTPPPLTEVVLIRQKGNDAVESGTDHLSAVAEVIGTF